MAEVMVALAASFLEGDSDNWRFGDERPPGFTGKASLEGLENEIPKR